VLKKLCWAQNPVGVSLLAMAVGSVNIDVAGTDAIASRLTPTGGGGSGTKKCGSWLASDGGGAVDIDVVCVGLIAEWLVPN
jgi:hypothetical protein